MEVKCPQCKKTLKGPASRLVQDTCGHKKCRICLLQDEIGCLMCKNKNNSEILTNKKESVIKYEDNHTAVITCNKYVVQANITNYSLKPHLAEDCNTKNTFQRSPLRTQSGNKSNSTKKAQRSDQKRSYQPIIIPNHVTVSNSNPVTFKCTICDKSFHTRSHVKYHKYCEGGKKPLECEECKKEFITKSHLDVHRSSHLSTKPFACDVCCKAFSQKTKLNRHKLLHSDMKPFVCQKCGKMFRSKESLHLHTLIHNGEKPYGCKLCGAKFNNTSNLNKHIVSHSKEKVHMCDQCGKRFKLKWALTVHRRSHSKIRPHKCTNCAKAFFNAKELHRHQLIHTDIKAYSCNICGTSFRRKDNLNRHMRNTHPGKKATSIKKMSKNAKKSEAIIDNPNAINVITASPAVNNIFPPALCSKPVLSKPVPVINAPLKLAFKTTAFKSHYNIHREYIEPPKILPKPYDMAESVNICQKILSPHSPPQTIIKKVGNVSEKESNEICQKILSPSSILPVNNENNFEHKKYGIRNIKFKLPNFEKNNESFNHIAPLQPVQNPNIQLENDLQAKVYAELKPISANNAATSVIVNSHSEMHWRRRTSQNLCLLSKNLEK